MKNAIAVGCLASLLIQYLLANQYTIIYENILCILLLSLFAFTFANKKRPNKYFTFLALRLVTSTF